MFRLQEGDHAVYGTVDCVTQFVLQYSSVQCVGASGYRVVYGPSQVRVLRWNGKGAFRTEFAAKPAERKQAEGKSRREAIRCLKRQLARTVYVTLRNEPLLT